MDNLEFEFDTFLRSSRKKEGLTLQALSELSGISTSQISKIERGVSFPTRNNVIALANALNIKEETMLIIAGYPLRKLEEMYSEIREKAEFIEKVTQEATAREVELKKVVESTSLGDWVYFWATERDKEVVNKEQAALLASEVQDFYTLRKRSVTQQVTLD